MEVTFFGTSGAIPGAGEDCPCFLINHKYMFDLGLYAPMSLVNDGIDPTALSMTLFTHMHHDHFLGLPMLLFLTMQSGKSLENTKLAGPAGTLRRTVDNALTLCKDGHFYLDKGEPQCFPLLPGESLETDDFLFETHASDHSVEGLCYRVTEKATGRVLGVTGDTAYTDDIADFFCGCHAIIHEATRGLEVKTQTTHNHSSIFDAIATADRAGIHRMFLVHTAREVRPAVLKYADGHFDGEALFPELGKAYAI